MIMIMPLKHLFIMFLPSGQEQTWPHNTRSGGLHRLYQRIVCECEYEWLTDLVLFKVLVM